MRAIVYTRYGPPEVLRMVEVAVPEPRAHEVLVKIHATSVTAADCIMRRGVPAWGRLILGLRKPRRRFRILGSEYSGEVLAVGANVSRFAPGDAVYGFSGFSAAAYAEYKCVPEDASIALKPGNLSFKQAAVAVDGATSAWFFLRDLGNVQPGQRVLIIGASGSLGSYAVQLARYLGAEVAGVCSGANAELVRSLGAQRVIDYAREDFTVDREHYDCIFDAVGKSSFARCRSALKPEGIYLPTVGLHNSVLARWTRLRGGKRVLAGMSIHKQEQLDLLRPLFEAGELEVVIDREYPLEQIAAAHAYVDTGRKRGNVVITVARPATAEQELASAMLDSAQALQS